MHILSSLGPLGLLIGVIGLVLAFHIVWFIVLPNLVAGSSLGSPELCRYLEWVAATPSLFGGLPKIWVRHHLLRILNHQGKAKRALEHGEHILRCKLPATLESEVRWRIADALESLGRIDEATWQRNRAKACLEQGEKDAAWYLSRGRALESQRDFPGACAAYRQAIERTPPENAAGRAFTLLSLALAEFHAGLVADSVSHAEEAAALAKDKTIRRLALRQASAAHATLGHIEESERFDRQACDLARELGDRKALAQSAAHLAENLRKRGQIEQALQSLEEIRGEAGDFREYHSIRYEALRSAGRFDEALQALESAGLVDPLGLGRGENKLRAIRAFGASRLLVELGRLDEGWARLSQAKQVLADDPKLAFWCQAAEARLQALQGLRNEAIKIMEQVEAGLNRFDQDRNTQLVALGNLGRTAEALGEFERGISLWQRYLEAGPNPVDQPTAYYHLGECRRGLEDLQAARQDYEQAVGLGLDTHESRLARQRLQEN